MDLMYIFEGNLGDNNGRINPLFVYFDKSIDLAVLERPVVEGHIDPFLLAILNEVPLI